VCGEEERRLRMSGNVGSESRRPEIEETYRYALTGSILCR
jgi:hypothetical protein